MTNYDQSSTGINIECSCFYDSERSYTYFRDNFEVLKKYENSYFFTCYGENDIKRLSEFKFKGRVSDFKALKIYGIERENYKNAHDFKNDTINELIADIGFQEAVKLCCDQNIELSYLDDIRVIPIHGYSQGDCAEIYVNFTELTKLWGKEPGEKELKEEFTNYFYDSLIYASLSINGEEYIYDLNPYDFERDKWLQNVSKESGVSIELLCPIVPKKPNYI